MMIVRRKMEESEYYKRTAKVCAATNSNDQSAAYNHEGVKTMAKKHHNGLYRGHNPNTHKTITYLGVDVMSIVSYKTKTSYTQTVAYNGLVQYTRTIGDGKIRNPSASSRRLNSPTLRSEEKGKPSHYSVVGEATKTTKATKEKIRSPVQHRINSMIWNRHETVIRNGLRTHGNLNDLLTVLADERTITSKANDATGVDVFKLADYKLVDYPVQPGENPRKTRPGPYIPKEYIVKDDIRTNCLTNSRLLAAATGTPKKHKFNIHHHNMMKPNDDGTPKPGLKILKTKQHPDFTNASGWKRGTKATYNKNNAVHRKTTTTVPTRNHKVLQGITRYNINLIPTPEIVNSNYNNTVGTFNPGHLENIDNGGFQPSMVWVRNKDKKEEVWKGPYVRFGRFSDEFVPRKPYKAPAKSKKTPIAVHMKGLNSMILRPMNKTTPWKKLPKTTYKTYGKTLNGNYTTATKTIRCGRGTTDYEKSIIRLTGNWEKPLGKDSLAPEDNWYIKAIEGQDEDQKNIRSQKEDE